MKPVSAALLDAITGSHGMVARARVVAPGQSGTDPDGPEITILGGDVQMDATADVWATLDLTTGGAGMWPTGSLALLAPYGNEVFVERGVVHSGTTEWVPLGYFRIQSPEQDRAPDGNIRVAGRDRMAGIIDARLLAPVEFPGSLSRGQVLDALIREVYPWVIIEWDSGDAAPIGRTVSAEDDRYAAAKEVVESAGKVFHFDHRGVLVIMELPDETTPVWTVAEGPGGVRTSLTRALTRDGVYNAVVATGEAADTQEPVRAVALDTDPNSPTRWGGPFGQAPAPVFYSPLLNTYSEALKAAQTILRKSRGVPYVLDFTSVPNPAAEPYDPVRVDTRDASAVHVLSTVTMPLTAAGALKATTREQRYGG